MVFIRPTILAQAAPRTQGASPSSVTVICACRKPGQRPDEEAVDRPTGPWRLYGCGSADPVAAGTPGNIEDPRIMVPTVNTTTSRSDQGQTDHDHDLQSIRTGDMADDAARLAGEMKPPQPLALPPEMVTVPYLFALRRFGA